MVDILESVVAEVREKEPPPLEGPRILLTGSTLAMGDDKILHLTEEAGASIVIEEFAEGVRHYWEDVTPNGDLPMSLADRYFRRRVPPAWFRPSRERHAFLIKLAKDFNVDGVIWYQMMYRDSYDIESYYFPEILQRETGLPMLKIESDYDASEIGPMRTRVETFVEALKAGKKNRR
jgi:benzoyl-CoA reductase/2-hydroxyglutaryl-CoA dehydratase subunit BcrC/BadD/HgdB